MATRKTLNFLPDIFKTDINKKFLGATIDQLVSEAEISKLNGLVGRKFSSLTNPSDNFILEPTDTRQNYQFEPAVIVNNESNGIELYGDYQALIEKISYYGGITDNHNRLFESEYYSYNPRIDLDKFVNYTRYFWLPNGPDTVTVSSGVDGAPKAFNFTRNDQGNSVVVNVNDGNSVPNPTITLVRGTTYQFVVDQVGHPLWIQTEIGTDGKKDFDSAVSTRDIYGIDNNGTDNGIITLEVPERDSQDYYFKMPILDFVDYSVSIPFSEIDGQYWNQPGDSVGDIDGDPTYPDRRYVIFTSTSTNNNDWINFNGATVPVEKRHGLWQITIDATSKIKLEFIRNIPIGYRVRINHGDAYTGYEFFKNSSGNLVQSPPITAPLSTLYYQDQDNELIYGKIVIVDRPGETIDVTTDIIGQKNYTSFNGVVFTNGLKIKFDDTIFPVSYRGVEYIVEGVGISISLIKFSDLDPVESIIDTASIPFDTDFFDSIEFEKSILTYVTNHDYIVMNRQSIDLNAWVRTNRWYHEDVIRLTAEYNKTTLVVDPASRAKRPIIEFEPNLQLFNSGKFFTGVIDRIDTNLIGNLITDAFLTINDKLVSDFAGSGSLKYKEGQLTIFPNDINSEVRRRIYRVSFKNQSAATSFAGTLTGTISTVGGSRRASGIGTSFLAAGIQVGTLLYNSSNNNYIGKVLMVLSNTDLLLDNNVAQTYTEVTVKYNYPRIALEPQIVVAPDHVVVARTGSNKNRSYWFDGSNWIKAQLKTSFNQPILFDLVDKNDISLSNQVMYPTSTFAGTEIFSYVVGSSTTDSVLGFSLKYSGIGNSVSDINFKNNFDSDTFTYKPYDYVTKNISDVGYLRKNVSNTEYKLLNSWNTVAEESKQYQHMSDKADGTTNYFEIDILPDTVLDQPNVKVFVNNKMIATADFELVTIGIRHAVHIKTTLILNDKIDILVFNRSNTSELGYYQIPGNLEFNAQNILLTTLTLGQIKGHWDEIGKNTNGLIGDPLATNNLRDLNTQLQSGSILQHSSPLLYPSLFLLDSQVNFINGVELARKDYSRFKNKFLELCTTTVGLSPADPAAGVDKILKIINGVKNQTFAWHYSDMIPWGGNFVTDTYKIINAQKTIYTLNNIYNAIGDNIYPDNGVSNKAVLVYLNSTQLTIGVDYTITAGNPYITLDSTVTLVEGDILTIKGYKNTDGSYVPETPTKLGMYPKFIPEKILDNSYRTPIYVIQGHDGSLTPTFGDLRDDYLLELEKRIFNNLKVEYNAELFDMIAATPGKFRASDYSRLEFNQVLNSEFLKWIGTNQLDAGANNYFLSNDEFSWNYNQTVDSFDGGELPGYWRGIYRYFYDTERPNTHPWEMLGITVKPFWWESYYGVAPYASTNSAMWTDISLGYIKGDLKTNINYVRPGLLAHLPIDTNGDLVSPLQAKLVGSFNGSAFSQSYAIGDQGPVESAWRKTSDYVFSLNRALAVLKPAKYFGLMINTAKTTRDDLTNQFVLTENKKRVTVDSILINGETVSGSIIRASSYINWIHGYLTNLGVNAATKIRTTIDHLGVKLGYKMAGYTDKKYITALVEQYSPNSTNQSAIVPDENYIVYLNKSAPIRKAVYSAVIIRKTTTGYSVNGYNLNYPYFTVIPSQANGNFYTIESLTTRAVIYRDYQDIKLNIPYGYEFASSQELVDFLVGYGRYLTAQGFIFDTYETNLKEVKNWILSAKEFLAWTLQGWNEGSVLILSPVSYQIEFFANDGVIDEITNIQSASHILGPNFNVIRIDELSILKEPTLTTVTAITGQTIAFIELNLVQFEHALIFDNTTIFDDVIYRPELGSRQYRIKLIGSKTTNWDGSLNPSGFIYNTGSIDEWAPGYDYKKADIVSYKNQNFTAIADVSASDKFEFDKWSLTDRKITSGLVPNFAQNSSKFDNIYDIDNPNIDENFASYGRGLIGFRNRSYLEDLGMDQTSQSKFYQGFIKEKGTLKSIEALFYGSFDNITNNVTVAEDWGLRVGEYGAIKTNLGIDLILNETTFKDNPLTLTVIKDDEVPEDGVPAFRARDLISRPHDFKSPIFLNLPIAESLETDLKTAGYVNINDVDELIFDLNDYANLTTTALSNLATGYKIWVAKDFNRDWQVYKTIQTINEVNAIEYSLDNKIKITTKFDHGLQIGNVFAIRDIDSAFDGFYQVLNVETSNTLISIIDPALIPLIITTPIYGAGALFELQQSRFKTAEDRDTSITKNLWDAGDLTWIDQNDLNGWSVNQFVGLSTGIYSGPTSFWGINNGTVTIRSSGLPYHAYGTAITTATATTKHYIRSWPLRAGANVAASTPTAIGNGIIGFCLNGVPIYSPTAEAITSFDLYLTIAGFNYNLAYSNFGSYEIDTAGGTSLADGTYLYRSFSFRSAWENGQGGVSPRESGYNVPDVLSIPYYNGDLLHSDGHSKIIGFASDGYPIYGPYGYAVPLNVSSAPIRMISSYRLKDLSYREPTEACDLTTYPMGIFIQDYAYSEGYGTLDAHNGRYCITPDYPNGTYAYFATIDDIGPAYPYFVGPTYYGDVPTVSNSLIGGPGIAPYGFQTISNPVWTEIKKQMPTVDINSVKGLHIFNNISKTIIARLDFIDPVKGKILGTAEADIDFITSVDPAFYNNGTDEALTINIDYNWGKQQVGKIWWDLDAVRYYDYEQGSVDYRKTNWGKFFTGSNIFVYEWVESDVLPSGYVAAGLDGIPKLADDSAYGTLYYVDSVTLTVRTKYYYWVRAKNSVGLNNKLHSVLSLEQLIANPIMQNIPYAALLNDKTIAVYNVGKYLSGNDIALHIDYSTSHNENIVHSEYELFQQGNKSAVMHPRIETKLIDSLVGTDADGQLVPDPNLLPADRLGLSNKPRQTLIVNRLKAIENIIKFVNLILVQHPVASRIFNKQNIYSDNFYAQSPYPNEYDYTVDSIVEMDYIAEISSLDFEFGKQYVISQVGNTTQEDWNIAAGTTGATYADGDIFTANSQVSGTGYAFPSRVLVKYDVNYSNRWTLYQMKVLTKPLLIKIQGYNATNFWNFVDWYAAGYDSKTLIINKILDNYNQTYTTSFTSGEIVRINDNGDGLFGIYKVNNSGKFDLIALESGSIQLTTNFWKEFGYSHFDFDSDTFDFNYFTELRFIFNGLKQDIFTKDLAIYYNQFLFYIIEYILSEQKDVDWIFKTSFISIQHTLTGLIQTPTYIKDRQDLYRQYIEEVKPYRTKIKEYTLNYANFESIDTATVTDFDLPAYYEPSLGLFRSPNGEMPEIDANLLLSNPKYQDWNNHHKYTINSVEIANSGFGFIVNPDISIISTDTTGHGANAKATIFVPAGLTSGNIATVTVTDVGQNYTSTPLVVVNGTGATQTSISAVGHHRPAVLSPRMTNKKIRKINTTIKFDRVQYTSKVVDWTKNTFYSAGAYVSYQGQCYKIKGDVTTSNIFDRKQFDVVSVEELTNANDRIMAFYQPTSGMVPKILSRLMTGLDRPQTNANLDATTDTLIYGGGFSGAAIPAGQFVTGQHYIITVVGSTNFTLIGASSNKIGLRFTATGPGAGTGSAAISITTDQFGNVAGVSPENISVYGGAFVSETFSHAPEELLPGITYDSLGIRVLATNGNGYHQLKDMLDATIVRLIETSRNTTITRDLKVDDLTITVADATLLFSPNPINIIPGKLFINGEEIHYYTKSGNTLGQLRRGVGGTGTPLVHLSGSAVENANVLTNNPDGKTGTPPDLS